MYVADVELSSSLKWAEPAIAILAACHSLGNRKCLPKHLPSKSLWTWLNFIFEGHFLKKIAKVISLCQ